MYRAGSLKCNGMCFDAFCPSRLVTVLSIRKKEQRIQFLQLFHSCSYGCWYCALWDCIFTTSWYNHWQTGWWRWRDFCLYEHLSWLSFNTQNGTQGCSSPGRDHFSVLNGNEEKVIHPPWLAVFSFLSLMRDAIKLGNFPFCLAGMWLPNFWQSAWDYPDGNAI